MFLAAADLRFLTAILLAGGWLLTSLYWASVCGYVAQEKGRNANGWAIAGFFGWILAFLPIAVVPSLRE